MSFFVQQKLMKVTFTKSEPKQTVTVFSSSVSWDPIVTICLSFRSCKQTWEIKHALVTWVGTNINCCLFAETNIKQNELWKLRIWFCCRTHLWLFSILSCPDVTNCSNIQQIHFMVLVKPIKIKALIVYPQRNGRSRSGILRKEKCKIIYYSCFFLFFRQRVENFLFSTSEKSSKREEKKIMENENVILPFFFLVLNCDFVP